MFLKDQKYILDGGTGFSANPSVSIRPNDADTISTNALLDTRITDGVITKTKRKFLSMKAKVLILSLVSIYFLVAVNGSLFMKGN